MRNRVVLCLVVVALASTLATPASAVIADLQISVEPGEPNSLQPFEISVEFSSFIAELGAVAIDGSTISIEIRDLPCLITCGPIPFQFDIPFEPLPTGAYLIQVVDAAGEVLGQNAFNVSGPPVHDLRPQVQTLPQRPNDNQRIQLLVPVFADDCRHFDLEISRVDRSGQEIDVFLTYEEPICAAVVVPRRPRTLNTDLGRLPAGDYDVSVYLTVTYEDLPDDPPILVQVAELEIIDSPDFAVLRDDRFQVSAHWRDFEGNTGSAKPASDVSTESALFTFFDPENWEIMIKVLDGCAINGHFWVLGAAATNVEYSIEVLDVTTGETWSYENPLGELSEAYADTEAFVCQ